jgi:pimeloyl-ACP methyl ester carboxylesterase
MKHLLNGQVQSFLTAVRCDLSARALLITLLFASPTLAATATQPSYIDLSPAKGVVYLPIKGNPVVAVLAMHRTMNFLTHPACTELSKRGFLVLCMNSRFENNEAQVRFEELALDVKMGVEYLRNYPGISTILLWGHSGGAPIMSFYSAVAEKGSAYCRDSARLSPCNDPALDHLPAIDGLILTDGHPGNPTMVMRGLNPAVSVQSDGKLRIDPSLDALSVTNGFNRNGQSHYSSDFRSRFFAAQAGRMQSLIAQAQALRTEISKGQERYPDDDMYLIPGGGPPSGGITGAVHLYVLDPSIDEVMSTERPHRIILNNGQSTTAMIHSVFKADPQSALLSRTFRYGTKQFTVSSFLSANAVRATDSIAAIEECSTNNSTLCALPQVTVPLLVVGMGASILIRDAERFEAVAASHDKELVYIEGANHWYAPCRECGANPAAYENATRNFFDYVSGWINRRFVKEAKSVGQ